MGVLRIASTWDKSTYGNKVETLRVLIECEKGSVHKMEYDETLGTMAIVRDLHKKYPYPYNYGSIPQTLAPDGDSLDAIVMSDAPSRAGSIVNCRPIAVVRMTDNGAGDDKVICAPFYLKHGQVNMKKILKYLQNYKYPYQKGTVLNGVEGAEAAIETINKAHRAYMEKLREVRT